MPQEVAWDGTLTVKIEWPYFGDDDCYLYVWYTDGTNDVPAGDWPGVKMEKQEDGTYKLEHAVDTTKTFKGLIVVRVKAGAKEAWNKTGDITKIPSNHVIVVTDMVEAN